MTGPSWQAIADRYQNQDNTAAALRDRMKAGSQTGKAIQPEVEISDGGSVRSLIVEVGKQFAPNKQQADLQRHCHDYRQRID